jgi:outer membrane cobalamin receptor
VKIYWSCKLRGSLNSIVRNKTFLQLLTLILALLFSSFALAEDRVSLFDIVVTSKPVDGFNQTLNDTHLNQEDLQRSGQREITNILRATPDLALSQGMKGGASTISLRGASGSVGLVNIDGIPLHDTWPGALNLDLFPVETFGSTDIQRGSAAIINFGRSLGGHDQSAQPK